MPPFSPGRSPGERGGKVANHDKSYKQLFSHPEMVADLLRGFIREEWVEQLGFWTLEKVSSGFVSDVYRNGVGDGGWRVRWVGGGWGYVLLRQEVPAAARACVA